MDESEINTVFYELMRNVVVPEDISDSDFDSLIEDTESIDDLKERLLDKLSDYLAGIEAIDMSEDEDVSDISVDLSMCINRYFLGIDGLDFKDEVIVQGDAIILLDDGRGTSPNALPIPAGCQIVGSLEYIIVTEIPTMDSIPAIRERSEQFIDEINPYPTIRFGLAFTLNSPVIVSPDGNVEYIPEEYIVHVPINYPQLQLKRLAQ